MSFKKEKLFNQESRISAPQHPHTIQFTTNTPFRDDCDVISISLGLRKRNWVAVKPMMMLLMILQYIMKLSYRRQK